MGWAHTLLDLTVTQERFEEYHAAIYGMETRMLFYTHGMAKDDNYQKTVEELDRTRTICHNAVLVHVNILNRMAKHLANLHFMMVSSPKKNRTGGKWQTQF